MTEGFASIFANYGALPLAVALFFYSFVHSEIPLKLACAVSAFLYSVCFFLSDMVDTYALYYQIFMVVDLVWLILLWKFCGVSRVIVGIFAVNMTVLSTMPAVTANHWFFYELYDYSYTALQVVFVASLTILPSKYPLFFQSPYDERDNDEDSLRFFSGELLTNISNSIHTRGFG